ncbi:hypothetical protein [Kineosporia mesophila]|uniref:hypothetical protein n=1 Tax=Kineosporia mesophila TaxID=566012 RepID=UPI001E373C54|nr:hypothetical protein [Kineosporia mesophila]MCD5351108.1 hypothetical protein [Kineosporia mesophila]
MGAPTRPPFCSADGQRSSAFARFSLICRIFPATRIESSEPPSRTASAFAVRLRAARRGRSTWPLDVAARRAPPAGRRAGRAGRGERGPGGWRHLVAGVRGAGRTDDMREAVLRGPVRP